MKHIVGIRQIVKTLVHMSANRGAERQHDRWRARLKQTVPFGARLQKAVARTWG